MYYLEIMTHILSEYDNGGCRLLFYEHQFDKSSEFLARLRISGK